MKFFFIISLIVTVAVAQQPSLNCDYSFYNALYGCFLTINNPDGLNDFTQIGGIHLEGFTNADVEHVYRISGVSTNVPSIICDTFPNLVRIDLYNTGLTEIDGSSFGACSLVTELILRSNRISSVSTNAFGNLHDIRSLNLEFNLLTTLPENVFVNQQSLVNLNMQFNPFEEIPVTLFRPLDNLEVLNLVNANIDVFNNQWFTTNARLSELLLTNNRIAVLEADSFVGLDDLHTLNLGYNVITEITAGTFTNLPNLEVLYLYNNRLSELQEDSFPDLGHLDNLDIRQNPIEVIHDGAFRGLVNLTRLSMSSCNLSRLNSNSFEGLGNLNYILLDYNLIEELPQGVFVPLLNINYIGLLNNRLKTLRRNNFGSLTSLKTLDLEANILNAVEEAIIVDAVNLNALHFSRNLCADSYFGNFQISREQYLRILERCFSNFRFIVDAITEGGEEFNFFEGPQPGIALRVNTETEAHIALTPFNFAWIPMIEILIGTSNNTRSTIRRNQEINVVTVPTPNILTRNQWNDFRVTWANQIILVYRGNDSFPFLAYTMQDFFPVNFYGLRAVETNATWIVQPFDW